VLYDNATPVITIDCEIVELLVQGYEAKKNFVLQA
jgi:hypothetical protein